MKEMARADQETGWVSESRRRDKRKGQQWQQQDSGGRMKGGGQWSHMPHTCGGVETHHEIVSQ